MYPYYLFKFLRHVGHVTNLRSVVVTAQSFSPDAPVPLQAILNFLLRFLK